MKKHLSFALMAGFLGLVACGNSSILNVKTGPGTEYPCGVDGVVCLGMDGNVNHMCCPQNNTCGGGKYSVGCPANMCCFIGDGDDSDTWGARRHAPTPQVPEHQ